MLITQNTMQSYFPQKVVYYSICMNNRRLGQWFMHLTHISVVRAVQKWAGSSALHSLRHSTRWAGSQVWHTQWFGLVTCSPEASWEQQPQREDSYNANTTHPRFISWSCTASLSAPLMSQRSWVISIRDYVSASSFKKSGNKSGPQQLPCGTPQDVLLPSERSSYWRTLTVFCQRGRSSSRQQLTVKNQQRLS